MRARWRTHPLDAGAPVQDSWSTWSEALHLVVTRANRRRSGTVAILVGTILLLINQGPTLVGGHLGLGLRALLTYLVPFLVSSYGFLSATRRRDPDARVFRDPS